MTMLERGTFPQPHTCHHATRLDAAPLVRPRPSRHIQELRGYDEEEERLQLKPSGKLTPQASRASRSLTL